MNPTQPKDIRERIYRVVGTNVHLSDEDTYLLSSLLDEMCRQAFAQALAGAAKLARPRCFEDECCPPTERKLRSLLAAAIESITTDQGEQALEIIKGQAYEAGTVVGAEQLVASILEGGEFSEGRFSVMKRKLLERLVEEELRVRVEHQGMLYDPINSENDKRIAELQRQREEVAREDERQACLRDFQHLLKRCTSQDFPESQELRCLAAAVNQTTTKGLGTSKGKGMKHINPK